MPLILLISQPLSSASIIERKVQTPPRYPADLLLNDRVRAPTTRRGAKEKKKRMKKREHEHEHERANRQMTERKRVKLQIFTCFWDNDNLKFFY